MKNYLTEKIKQKEQKDLYDFELSRTLAYISFYAYLICFHFSFCFFSWYTCKYCKFCNGIKNFPNNFGNQNSKPITKKQKQKQKK